MNYRRSTVALAIKCHAKRLMNKGARTLYYEDNLIVITTEEATHVSIDDNLFDFSYELEPKNFHQCEPNLPKSIKQKKTRQRHN